MGKNIGWRPRRGHLAACALSVLAMAAGSSSAVAGVTSVVVPVAEIKYSCTTVLNGPASISLGTTTAVASTNGSPGSHDDDTEDATNEAATRCTSPVPFLGPIKIYNIGNATVVADIDNTGNTEEPLVDARNFTTNNVSFLGDILKYTKKTFLVVCDVSRKCESRAVYTGLKFAGVSRTLPETTDTPTKYDVNDFDVNLLGDGPCGTLGVAGSVARFTGTLTLNSSAINTTTLTVIPLRLTGELNCVSSLNVVNVDIQDMVEIKADDVAWKPGSITTRVAAN